MASNPQQLYALGQSIWYDNIERRLLDNGELKAMIERGDIYGVTSNPSIFHNAIVNSSDYDTELKRFALEGKDAGEIFDLLAIQDIQAAADMFLPLYEESQAGDGYVSIEVHPDYARDTEKTISEAERLWKAVDRPNLMVKIPATKEGLPAIQASIAAGININITLIFSQSRYAEVIDAYLAGLEERASAGKEIKNIASVASFFISRIDSKIDAWLDALDAEANGNELKGKIAISNARQAYRLFLEQFSSPRFLSLQAQGTRKQRPLWASTSTKNPTYNDVLYIDELIGADTVNTVPPKTLEAYKDHGLVDLTIEKELEAADKAIVFLNEQGLSLDQATQELEIEGVEAFSKAIHSLLKTVEERRKSFSQ
jgi:transaldolase